MLFAIPMFFALASAAMPQEPAHVISREALGAMTIKQATGICDAQQQVHCCTHDGNAEKEHHKWSARDAEGAPSGWGSGPNEVSIFDKCSPLAEGGVEATLSTECKGKIACCNKSVTVNEGGYINNGGPNCVVYGNLQ